ADYWDGRWPVAADAPFGFAGWQAAFIGAALPGIVLAFFMWRLPEPVRGVADGITVKPDPAPFKASFGLLGAILPIGVWLNFLRRGASAKDWMLSAIVLGAVIAGGIFLARFPDGLRDTNPIVIPIGDGGLTGNGIQWLVSGFGVYV